MFFLRFLISFVFATIAFGGNPVIFQGNNARMIPQGSLVTKQGQNVVYNGLVNYIQNQGAEGDTSGSSPANWTRYQEGLATPTSCSTGTPTGMTLTANATTPLRNYQDFQITKAIGDQSGAGVATSFTISGADTNKMLALSFDVKTPSAATYTTGDLAYFIYDVTSARLITPTNNSIPSGFTGTISNTFLTSASTSYRLCIQVASTTSNNFNVNFDNFYVGPGQIVQGPAISDWSSYTPTVTNIGSGATVSGKWRRNGNVMEVRIATSFGSAGTASTLIWSLPTGYTIDTSSLPGGSNNGHNLGSATTYNVTAASQYDSQWMVFPNGTTGISVTRAGSATTTLTGSVASPVTASLGFSVPIAEWASSAVNVGQAGNVEYASNDTSGGVAVATTYSTGMVIGQAGSVFPAITTLDATNARATKYLVRFPTPIQNYQTLQFQMTNNTVGGWIEPDARTYNVSKMICTGGAANGCYGVGIEPVAGSTTDVYAVFGNGGTMLGSAYTGNGFQTWSALSGNLRWRIVKPNVSSATGFNVAQSPNTPGLYAPGQVAGYTGGVTIGAGYVGETLSSGVVNQQFTNASVSYANIVLTPGVWNVTGICNISSNPNTRTYVEGSVVATTPNVAGTFGTNRFIGAAASNGGTASNGQVVIPHQIFNITTNTTVYITCLASISSSGTGDAARIWGTRIQ